jgi:hypothetical protein
MPYFFRGLLIGLALAGFAGGLFYKIYHCNSCSKKSCDTQTNLDEKKIEDLVINLVKNKPEEFSKAISEGAKKQEEHLRLEMINKAKSMTDKILKTGFCFGNPSSKIKLIAFVDPACPHSNSFLKIGFKLLDSGKDFRLQIISGSILGEKSVVLNRTLILVKNQGLEKLKNFWQKLIELEDDVQESDVNLLFKETGVDKKKVEQDINKNEIVDEIKASNSLLDEIGIPGVPMVFLIDAKGNLDMVPPSSFEEFLELIDNAKTGINKDETL